jgi:hypothetical protein
MQNQQQPMYGQPAIMDPTNQQQPMMVKNNQTQQQPMMVLNTQYQQQPMYG